MGPVVVLPIKSFDGGMQRLSSAIDGDKRSGLGRAIASHVAETVDAVGLVPLVVTADTAVAMWATGLGFPPLPDPGGGLDAAARAGAEWAMTSHSPWLVLHSDLPLLQTSEVQELAGHLVDGRDVIAPSADGGTSAIGSSHDVSFAFGRGSFQRHLAQLDDPVVISSVGLLHDIDTPDDLRSGASTGRADWLKTYIVG